ncbi:MAG: flippase-like domain-containing protein, partial [Bacteroidia bacterium]|nr:flippase-like domain-containing protein [Bacteroidia bacterium]
MSALKQLQKYFEGKRLLLPIAIGLAVAFYFFSKDFDPAAYNNIQWGQTMIFWLILAFTMLIFRYLGYVFRLRILSDKVLSWTECFQLVLLWEFSSAISPGIVGGTAAAFVLLAQEKKLDTGKSTAIVLATSYLDVLFYILAVPLILVLTGLDSQIPETIGPFSKNLVKTYFLFAYVILFIWAMLVYIGIFIRPTFIKRALISFFKLPFLKRWKDKAYEWGDEIIIAAEEYKKKKKHYWFKAFGATAFSWISRFLLVNFLILALGYNSSFLDILSRQLIMWGALLIPVTPGASGMAELLFPAFLGEYFSNIQLANTTSVLWRLISYYPYLILGFVVFPVWIKRIIKE